MDLKVLNSTKEEIEIEVGDVTIAEILRVYLNKDVSVDFVAWKREHYTKDPILSVKTLKGKDVKKTVVAAANKVVKDLESIESNFKKMK